MAATLLVTLAFLTTIGYAAWRQQQALREGQRALRMQTFMYRLFKLANSNYTGKPAATVPEFLQLGVKILPDYIKDPVDLRKAQMGLAESMFENGDLANAQRVFTKTTASAKAAGDVEAEAESEAFSGNIAYLQGKVELGQTLTAHALALSRKPGISPAVRAWSAIYYAWNRDNNGFRSDENVRLLQFAVKHCRDHNLSPRETADALYNLGEDLELRGRLDEAEQMFNQTLQVYSQDPSTLCEQSEIFGELAYIKDMRGDVPASLPLYQRAWDGYKACSGAESRGALTEQEYLAGALIKLGRAREALPMMEAAMPPLRKILGTSPDLAEPLNSPRRTWRPGTIRRRRRPRKRWSMCRRARSHHRSAHRHLSPVVGASSCGPASLSGGVAGRGDRRQAARDERCLSRRKGESCGSPFVAAGYPVPSG